MAVISFSDYAEAGGSAQSGDTCYNNELALASGQTKDALSSFIDALYPDGMTYYDRALQAAYDLFSNTPVDSTYPERGRDYCMSISLVCLVFKFLCRGLFMTHTGWFVINVQI